MQNRSALLHNEFKVISNESFLSKLNFSAMGRLAVAQKQGTPHG